ncbi:hypothetical protein [Microbacterium sp.]|uniref:hypothetical protein n=1 Tax=Microbacterium sp. TaxID=51671 RepID=UPI0039E27CAD
MSTLGVLAQGLSRFAYAAVVGRALGADVLSAVNVAFAASILLSLAWPTAAGNAAAAFARPGHGGERMRRRLQRSLLVSLVPIGGAAALLAVALGGSVLDALTLVALTAGWSGYIYGRGLLMGAGRAASAALWDIVTAVLAIGLLAVVVLTGAELFALVPAVVGYGTFAVAAAVIARRALRDDVSAEPGAPRVGSFIVWNSLALIATNGLMQLSMVIAYAFDSPAHAGQFAAALSLATPVSMISQAVTLALLPRFGAWAALPGPEQRLLFVRALAAVGGVLAVGCALVALLMPWVLPLFFGAGFGPAVALAQLLMVGVFGFSVSVLVVGYLSATGRARRATLLSGVSSLVGVTCMVWVALAADGVSGALWGVSVGMTLSAAALCAAAMARRASTGPGGAHRL